MLLVVEVIRALIHKSFRARDYKRIFFTYVLNRVLGAYISIAALAFSIALFQPCAPFKSTITWYWMIYGYVVWELGHFLYHFLALWGTFIHAGEHLLRDGRLGFLNRLLPSHEAGQFPGFLSW